ncbi:MAG: class I SAM-dependent methyltransferase [Candidatus Bathyarchaeia archaeon]|jgi:ubiquinone/menaquinone biosynthesis C-methylase UbiE
MLGWHKKRRVMLCYDTTATIYEKRYAEEQAAKVEAALKHVKIEKEGLILDVGCGTGILFDYITNEANGVVGLDFSKKCLLQARERIRNKRLRDVQLIQADADNMPFHNEAFNTVFAMTILQNTPSPNETLAEIKRVSGNNALFVITGLKKIFTKEGFEQLLKNSQLNTLVLEDEKLKCYVAVCTNSPILGLSASQKEI